MRVERGQDSEIEEGRQRNREEKIETREGIRMRDERGQKK